MGTCVLPCPTGAQVGAGDEQPQQASDRRHLCRTLAGGWEDGGSVGLGSPLPAKILPRSDRSLCTPAPTGIACAVTGGSARQLIRLRRWTLDDALHGLPRKRFFNNRWAEMFVG
ncbi:hypothetical protein CDAR_367201 [Caerostris darwini]|uniref:Uncharacterized protein n=1 Tax=Caerostris darwini TaxID=1538125 RepID=A0AAV4WMR8_9ARAC|nr:hypothetical protein CDAR_367201 [Caerostris darwini]